MDPSNFIQLKNGIRFMKIIDLRYVPRNAIIYYNGSNTINYDGFVGSMSVYHYERSPRMNDFTDIYVAIKFSDIIQSVSNFSTITTQKSNLFLECESMDEVIILLKNGYTHEWCEPETLMYILQKVIGCNSSLIKIMMDMIPCLKSSELDKEYKLACKDQTMTLLQYACLHDSVELLQLLLSSGANFDPIKIFDYLRMHDGDIKVISYLVTEHKIDVNYLVNSRSLLCRYLQNDYCERDVIYMLASDITLQIDDNVIDIWNYVRDISEAYDLLKILISWGVLSERSTLFEMYNLKEIHVANAGIKEIPELVTRLRLETLSLPFNNIEIMPASISKMFLLRKLILHDNQIKEIPKAIGKLVYMAILSLHNNPIIKVPRSIKHFNMVRSFSIDSTHIKNKNRFIKRSSKIESAMLIDNVSLADFVKQLELTSKHSDPYTLPMLIDAYGRETRMPGELAIAQCTKSSRPFPQLDRIFIEPSVIRCTINHKQIDKYFHEGIYVEIPVDKCERSRIVYHKLMIHDKDTIVKFFDI